MNILLDTAVVSNAPLQGASLTGVDAEYNVSEPKIYPSDSDVIITVGTGQMAVITAYFSDSGDPNTQLVEVFKVLMTSGGSEVSAANCGQVIAGAPVKKLREAKLSGWELKEGQPVLVIRTPGKYEFKPGLDSADSIITAKILPLQEFNRGLDRSSK